MNREIDLKKILSDHKQWLESDGTKGSRAHLGGADLRYANLRDADLGDADLHGAYLRYANLGGANLHGANLRDANLGGANLHGAYLRYANLGGANLHGAYLRYANLGDANLGDAKDCIEVPVGDPRAYRCVAIRFGEEWSVFAGCRGPLSLEGAEKHWGADYRGDREIGDRYLHGLKWLREHLAARKGKQS